MPDDTRSFVSGDVVEALPGSRPSDTPTTAGAVVPDATAPVRVVPTGYEIGAELGRGGMGVVYRALDRGLQREVAVKILLDCYAPDSNAAERFLAEARITGQLQHPGIPSVHQVGTLPDGRPYLAMKLIKGRTLNDLLATASVDYLAVFEAICQAVGYAHAHGVIHRDLKPHNVMVGAFGEVQVMDWGLAKQLRSAATPLTCGVWIEDEESGTPHSTIRTPPSEQTQAGSVMGTPAYMSPEQAAGETDRIDERSDVFSLGAILCVLLTGQTLYAGKDADTVRIAALRGNTGAALARLDACGVEPDIVALCKRCLAFEPADRPAQAGALAAEVANIRRAAEERAKLAELERARAEVRAAEQRKRRRVLLVAALGVGLVLLAGIVGTALGLWRAETQRGLAERERDAKETARAAEAEQRRAADLAYTLSREALIRVCRDLPFILQQGIYTQESRRRANAVLLEAMAKQLDPTAVRGLPGRAVLTLHLQAGDLLREVGKPKEAAAHFAQALEVSTRLLEQGGFDPAVTRGNHALILWKLAVLDRDTQRTPDASRSALAKLAVVERIQRDLLDHPPEGMRRTMAELRQSLAVTLLDIATTHRMVQDNNAAVAPCTEAIELLRPRPDDDPANPETKGRRWKIASTLLILGKIHIAQQNDRAAEAALKEAVAASTALLKENPRTPALRLETARAARELGDFLLMRDRLAESQPYYTQVLTTFRDLVETGEAMALRFEIGDAYYRTATLALKRKDAKLAIDHYTRCRNLWREVADRNPTVRNMLAVALAEARLGRHGIASDPAMQVLTRPGGFSQGDRMQAVCVLALCAGAVAGDRPVADLPAADATVRQRYVDAALAGLALLIEKAGFKDVARLKTDPDLDPIRGEEGFQALVKKLTK